MVKTQNLTKVKQLMAALLRMPPKQHKDMKLGTREADAIPKKNGESRAIQARPRAPRRQRKGA